MHELCAHIYRTYIYYSDWAYIIHVLETNIQPLKCGNVDSRHCSQTLCKLFANSLHTLCPGKVCEQCL